jgi:hypothetical protein
MVTAEGKWQGMGICANWSAPIETTFCPYLLNLLLGLMPELLSEES